MNDKTAIEKADDYVRHIISGGKFEISEAEKKAAESWILADKLMMRYPKESDARRIYMDHQKCSESKAIRDFATAQYVFAKCEMPNRSYEIKKQMDRSDKLYDLGVNMISSNPTEAAKVIKNALEMRSKAIAMLPEEMEPPDLDKYNKRMSFTTDVSATGKPKKEIKELKDLFARLKAKNSPTINFDGTAEDATVIRS